jgi:tetratricopeptide (TPR) repeat protein/transcriptional regulator with XRE-family HTH domain
VAEPRAAFAGVLRQLRTDAGLTQEELAREAGLSLRAISDLERGVVTTPHKDTVRLLADALHLTGPARAEFEATARGRATPGGVAAATRTLPRDIASFTGRRRELDQLMEAAGAGGAVSIHAIGGMAGVGKTAFAVHAAHRLADRFPAGQIFLPLHGHTPGQRPVDPDDALASLLLTIGVPAAQIPPGLEARMALWRDRLGRQQLLLILDDAVGSEQVLPLLPGADGSLVLVTSRRHLSALEDATVISLDTLPPDEAAGMLVRLSGRPGLYPSEPAVREIVGLCGFLPLAIGMVGRQLYHHPAWSARSRAAELAAARDRLELMATENVSVAAAFDRSYAHLPHDLQRLFRRLGLHPGADIDPYAAAALGGAELAIARRGLEALYDQYLLTELAPGRYRMHDLIREHARALAARDDPGDEQHQATARLLDYYQHTAAQAEDLIARQARPAPAPAAGTAPSEAPALADPEQALAWVRAERASLLACLDLVTATGQHTRTIALTHAIASLLRYDGPWAEAIARHATAVSASRQVSDRLGQAHALNDLGDLRRQTGDYPEAAGNLAEALAIYRDLDDRAGQAHALNDLGRVRRLTGDYPEAARSLAEALAIYRDLDDRLGQAHALRGQGDVRRQTGDYAAAARDQEQALAIYRDLGNRLGQAHALANLGDLRKLTGDYRGGARDQKEALAIYRDLGNRLGQAHALNNLGVVRRQIGDYEGASRDLAEALAIYRDLGNRLGQANALRNLGIMQRLTGDYEGASRDLAEALAIYRDLGNRLGQAHALTSRGDVRRQIGDYPGAARDQEEALAISRDLGNRLSQANALRGRGTVRRAAGDREAAARDLAEALAILRDIGARDGVAEILNEVGTLHRADGDLLQAGACHRDALDQAREAGISWDEAQALAGLGRCALSAGRLAEAEGQLRRALQIFQRIGTADAADVAAELDALPQLPSCPVPFNAESQNSWMGG